MPTRFLKPFLGLLIVALPGRANTLDFLNNRVQPRYRLETHENPFATRNIEHGYQVLDRILAGSYDHLTDRQTDGADVVAVMWALFDAAVQKGQGFEQGSFVVEDRDGYLFHFLKGNHEAAERHSSHLAMASRITNAGHYGIDILGSYQDGQWTPYSEANPSYVQQNILPARKGTILFIPLAASNDAGLATRHLFIKMEDHGLKTWYGYANHAWDFVTGTLMGMGNPHEIARKERVGKPLAKAYDAVLASVPRNHVTPASRQARELGVRTMVAEVERLRSLGGSGPAFQAFSAILEGRNYDHLGVRTGDEVILGEDELNATLRTLRKATPVAACDWIVDIPRDLPGEPEAKAAQPAGWADWVTSWFVTR